MFLNKRHSWGIKKELNQYEGFILRVFFSLLLWDATNGSSVVDAMEIDERNEKRPRFQIETGVRGDGSDI